MGPYCVRCLNKALAVSICGLGISSTQDLIAFNLSDAISFTEINKWWSYKRTTYFRQNRNYWKLGYIHQKCYFPIYSWEQGFAKHNTLSKNLANNYTLI